MSLESVHTFHVPTDIVKATERALRDAGRRGDERFVLWSGVAVGDSFEVRTAHVPAQTPLRAGGGVCVRVDGPALHELNVQLYDSREVLAVQVHTHPTQAYHSETDDAYPIVTLLGGLSLVIPYFCRNGLKDPGMAAYRLAADGWRSIQPLTAIRSLLVID